MEKFGKSQSVKRFEDRRFLTGQGRYVDDLAPEGALFAYFLRSTYGHGQITAVDATDASDMPGVELIVTVEDLKADGVTLKMAGSLITQSDGTNGADPLRPLLAKSRVRYVGEPIAMIIATSLSAAKDAADAIEVDIDDLPSHTALATGGELIHAEAPNNLVFDWDMGRKDETEDALANAAHVVELDIYDNRIICNAMEPRGCYAEIEDGRLHVAVNGQGVWGTKNELARQLHIPKDDIRVTNPDVGGGFGMKAMHYGETILVAYATRKLNKPVRWMSERTEGMLTDNGGRDLTSKATLGFDENHKMTAYKVDSLINMGAYNSTFAQNIQTELFSKVLMGTYDVQNAYMRTRGVYTNTTPIDAYRGAGRPEAIFVLERAMDEAARQLGIDPWELRRKNFIQPDQFPYTSATGMAYDIGDFERVLDKAAEEAALDDFKTRKAESARNGKYRGLGLCYYIESILGDPKETTTVEFKDGGALIYVGTQSNGQGHETVYAQSLSDQSGIPTDKITVVQGDSDRIASGGGTGGSRSGTVQNTATLAAVEKMIAAFSGFLAEQEGVAVDDVSFDDERFRIAGSNLSPTMLEAADLAQEAGETALLKHSARITLQDRSFPNGAHVAEVEVDPETGVTEVVRYTVVDDFGNLLNPMIVAGQVHGGVAQGLGQVLTEHVVYDDDGQLLTASFMDYAMPRADDLPMIDFSTEGTPSIYNPLGMKGCGEAGTVGAIAAVANAVLDAIWDAGVRELDLPYTPHRVWQALQEAQADSVAS